MVKKQRPPTLALVGALAVLLAATAAAVSADPPLPGIAGQDGPTASEVEQRVIDYFRYMRENARSWSESYSELGSLEFWSSGGLVMEVPPGGLEEEFEFFNLHPKHITVITLVPDQAAVAVFYAEGSLQPKGAPPVGRYLTRVTQVFVKEGGAWRIRSSHWSPLTGGAGTNQVSVKQ
jgi:hypothetical protein